MPRVCTVCAHPQRQEIDECLVSGQSNRGIAKQFGLDDAAVFRHRNAHLPAHVAKAHEAGEATRADDLLAQARTLYARALAVLDRAEERDDDRLALGAIREAGNTLRLLGEVLGRLQQGPQLNVLVLPEWSQLRSTVLEALAAFPEARTAVAGALRRIGDGAGTAEPASIRGVVSEDRRLLPHPRPAGGTRARKRVALGTH